MHPAGFELAIPASERPQTDASDRAANGLGLPFNDKLKCKQTEALYHTAFSNRTLANAQQVTLAHYITQAPVCFKVAVYNNRASVFISKQHFRQQDNKTAGNNQVKYSKHCSRSNYRGADTSLARPGRKQARATEDFAFHISYLLS